MFSLLYVIIAIFLLSFLIFIHELGHYIVARRVGMRVEAFGIGFGRPIYSWMRDGVEWRIGWLPFGGFVKIAGTEDEQEGGELPPDSFFAKPPIDRIKVAIAGPLANLVTAFIIFTMLWAMGGRQKSFSEINSRIGWIDPQSKLHQQGIRPGDEITYYNDNAFRSVKDHSVAPMTTGDELKIRGYKHALNTGEKEPFSLNVPVYRHPLDPKGKFKTSGILAPASYLIYQPDSETLSEGLSSGSPLLNSGIQPGDRIIWADGELLYSSLQLDSLLNDGKVLLTIQRGQKKILRRVPRVRIQELRIDTEYREELIDWQYESDLQKTKLQKLYTIPYNLTPEMTVESEIKYIESPQPTSTNPLDRDLKVGDRILAVGGMPISEGSELFKLVQEPRALMIVQRNGLHQEESANWVQAETEFMGDISTEDLSKLVASLGNMNGVQQSGHLVLLNPVIPRFHKEFNLSSVEKEKFLKERMELRQRIEALEDNDEKTIKLQILNESEGRYHVSPPYFTDRKVTYNPSPFRQFADVANEIYQTLHALVVGNLDPRFLAGPVGIVEIVKENWKVSIKEGLYWVGAISLNLGILNLLPVPVLDGGTICFCLYEIVTRKRIQTKTMERLTFIFAMLLISFFVFITYQDVTRVFGKYLKWLA